MGVLRASMNTGVVLNTFDHNEMTSSNMKIPANCKTPTHIDKYFFRDRALRAQNNEMFFGAYFTRGGGMHDLSVRPKYCKENCIAACRGKPGKHLII